MVLFSRTVNNTPTEFHNSTMTKLCTSITVISISWLCRNIFRNNYVLSVLRSVYATQDNARRLMIYAKRVPTAHRTSNRCRRRQADIHKGGGGRDGGRRRSKLSRRIVVLNSETSAHGTHSIIFLSSFSPPRDRLDG